jgi:flagellar basal body-associated protein FliL
MNEASTPKKIPRIIYLALLFIAGALIVLLLIGTIIGLIRSRNAEPVLVIGGSSRTEAAKDDDIRVYSGLERLRIPLSNSSTLLLSVAFPYSANDVPFTEELAAKIDDFKAIIMEYFSSLSAENANQINEEAVKQEILRRFNANLRLGRIDTLYFSDMNILESLKQ